MKKIFITLGILLLVVIFGSIVFIHIFTHKPLPNYDETIKLSGLNDTVEIYRDKYGIPHIFAKNDRDLYVALGYITAMDRLWQMDLIRRATQGRLAEIFGKDFADIDYKFRMLQISEKSQKLWLILDDTLKNILTAYAEGVNLYIENNPLPIEFKILGYKPEKWEPENSLNLVGYMAWDLGMAWGNEITLYKIKQVIADSLFVAFLPNFDNDSVIYETFGQLPENQLTNNAWAFAETAEKLGLTPFRASNNWAVSPGKSTTGGAILCNDMHLGFSIPGIWYQVHIVSPNVNTTGVLIPGAPVIVAGHNQDIAWGMTNVMLDDADFYVETLNSDTTKYLCDGKWLDLKIKTLKIATKEGDTIVKKLYFTHRGPIISYFKGLDKALSMAWIGYQMSNEVKALYLLNHAKNWNDFRKAASLFGSVAQNLIFADKNGNIGIQLTGFVPKRKTDGWKILPGDTTLYDWKGFIPFDSLPYEFNPPRGFVASANNKSARNLPYYISIYFYNDYRFDRIYQFLDSKDKLSADDMKNLQGDFNSILAKEMLPQIISNLENAKPSHPLAQKAIEILKNWNGEMAANKPAPLIFDQFYMEFVKCAVSDELGSQLFKEMFDSKFITDRVYRYIWQHPDCELVDNITTPEKENFAELVAAAFDKTLDTLQKQLGNNIENWKFSDIHTFTLEHPLASVKILDKIFDLNRGPYLVGGSFHTVSPYSYNFNTNYKVNHGASQRHIFITNNWDASQTVIPTGESGQPASPHYCDQTIMYINNIYHDDPFSKQAVMNSAEYKTVFVP